MTALRRPVLLFQGVVLTALWLVVLLALTEIFSTGPWIWKAWSVSAVVTLVPTVASAFLDHRRDSLSLAAGIGAGALCWLGWQLGSGRAGDWIVGPGGMVDAAVQVVDSASTPFDPTGAVEDLLLTVVLLLATASTVTLVGVGLPFAAAGLTALLLIVPAAVTGIPVDRTLVLAAGVALVLTAWSASPRMRVTGLVAACVAAALAAGVVAVLPDARDRVWNSAVVQSPVSGEVPDVTVSLAEDLQERSEARAFTFTADSPGSYRFTLATLEDFDDGRWLPQDTPDPSGATVDQPRTEETPFRPTRNVTVSVEGLRSEWLPLPQNARQAEPADAGRFDAESAFDPADWRWTEGADTAQSDGQVTRAGDSYTVEAQPLLAAELSDLGDLVSATNAPGAPDAELTDGEREASLRLPGEVPDALTSAATAAADSFGAFGADGADPLTVGFALQEMFRDGSFIYDESAPYDPVADPESPYAVMESLLRQRHGYCVHYASTFAVMARDLGVPARLSVGYAARVADDADEDTEMVVRGRQLHAWPEIFVDGAGWVAFEPTPGGAGGPASAEDGGAAGGAADAPAPPTAPDAASDSATASSPTPSPSAAESSAAPDASSGGPDDGDGADGSEDTGDAGDSEGSQSSTVLAVVGILGVVVLVVLLLGAPALVRRAVAVTRRRRVRRRERPAQNAWNELVDTAVDLRILPEYGLRAQTPEALAEYLGSDAAAELAGAVSAERYGGQDAGAAGGTEDALDRALAAMTEPAERGVRYRAVLLPVSLVRRAPQRIG